MLSSIILLTTRLTYTTSCDIFRTYVRRITSGDGVMGWLDRRFGKRKGVYAFEVRTKISTMLKGRPLSEETRTKMIGRTHSEETRKKISEAGRGRVVSEATRTKIAAALKGRTLSQEARARMSEAHKGRALSEQARTKVIQALTGRPVSEETRAKIRASRKANPLTYEAHARVVEARQVLTPEQVQEIRERLASGDSTRSIAQAYGVNYYTIWNILKGKTWSHLPPSDA